jgi:hypothetical protein
VLFRSHRLYEQFGFELNDKLMTRLAPAYDPSLEGTRSKRQVP